jgi:hypothetical protein
LPNDNPDHLAQALLFESGQAWEHYRHLEDLVNQYLAFYGGVVTAYVGITGLIFSRSGPHAIVNGLIIAAVIGPLVGTFGVSIMARVERLRYIRSYYYFEIIMPIRSYIFDNYAGDFQWVDKLNAFLALEGLRTRIRRERRLPCMGLRLGDDSTLAYIPLACLGAPFYALIASCWITFSPIQYAAITILSVYSFLIFLVMLELRRLRRKGVFGD